MGSIVTSTGIQMDPLKIRAIENWPLPKDAKALQRFLGAANFHREFSHIFSTIAAPLDAIRNSNGLIQWTDEQIQCL